MAGFFDRLVTRVARRDIARAQNNRIISTGSDKSKSSIEKLSLQLAQPISRRRALGWLGAAGTAATATMTGLWPGTAWAKSPNQGVCAPLNAPGVTSGLYGLCVAYCEAMNCPDVTAGASALRRGCKPPDKGVLANYNRLRKASDPQMPCVKSQCPCWTNTELSAIGISYLPHVVDWFRDDFPGAYFSVALVENRVATDEFPYGAYQVAQSVKNSDGTATCSYFKAEFQPGAPDPIIRVQEISTAEAGICEAQINGQVEDLLNEGVPVVCTGNACEPA